MGVGVGVGGRGGAKDTARLSPMLMTTSRLIIQSMIRVCLTLERRTVPPVNDCDIIIIAQWRRDTSAAYLKIVTTLLTTPAFRYIMTASQLMTMS